MRGVLLITGREMQAYLRGMGGYVVAALVLLINGILFNAFALGAGKKLSSEVLENFFYFSSGTTMFASVLLSMRLLAEERRDGTLVLLYTAPIGDWSIALGKWLSAFLFLALILAVSVYMPLLIAINGSINPGHVWAGYMGLLLLASACTALGTLASSLSQSQVVSAVLAATLIVGLLLCWMLSKVADPPFDTLFSHLALFDKHFAPFMKGSANSRDAFYYLSVTFFSLLLTRQVLGSRRWR